MCHGSAASTYQVRGLCPEPVHSAACLVQKTMQRPTPAGPKLISRAAPLSRDLLPGMWQPTNGAPATSAPGCTLQAAGLPPACVGCESRRNTLVITQVPVGAGARSESGI
jgi:hypothetical protein